MTEFKDIIAQWPDEAALALDAGVPRSLVAVWKHRNSIPANKWAAIIAGAERRGLVAVTLDVLADIEAQRTRAA